MVTTYTVCAYGGIGAIACGYWYLTNRRARRQPNRATQQKELKDRERERARAAQKEKKKIKSGGESSGNEAQKKKTKREPREIDEPIFVTTQDNTRDKDVDDREFARQLSSLKTGTTMAPRQDAGSRQKSVKLSKAMTSDDDDVVGWANAEHISDGDDDLSSAASPELNATVLKAGDVADMLESNNRAGPSILRLTEPTTTQPSKPKKAAKPAEPELTKKQRQNQAKNQAAKLQREEEEKVRRALEEKQRRTAREAEGRSAKDGSSTLYQPPPPKTSAWASSDASKPQDVELLETFASQPSHGGSGSAASRETVREEIPPPQSAPISHYSELPSEEEQMRLLSENDESGWAEVTSKKGKGKVVKASSEVPGAGEPSYPAVLLENLLTSTLGLSNITNSKFSGLGSDTEA